MTQNLPIGAVTSPHAVRLRRRRRALLPLPRPHVVCTVLGVAAAVAGAAVSARPAPVPVAMTASSYEIGGSRLAATAPGVYQQPGGAALVVVHAGGSTRAGASAALGGRPMTGTCSLPDGARTEVCRFSVGGIRVGAVDTWAAGVWHRHYDDGRTVDISVAAGQPVPVPFAIGR